jgi:hypothetical protein
MREGGGGTGEAGRGEEGGQWFVKLPNTTDGAPPPAGSPTHAVNIFVGNQFALGDYDMAAERWSLRKIDHRIDAGPTDGWSAASYAGDRLMNMGWAPRGRTPGGAGRMMNQNDQLTIMRDVRWVPRLQTLVANPVVELAALRNGTLAHVSQLTLAPGAVHTLPGTGGGQAASADVEVNFTLPPAGADLFGVSVLSGAAMYGGDADDSGVDVLVNVSAPASPGGKRRGFMTVSRRHGSCFYKDCCNPCPRKPPFPPGCGQKGGGGGGNCTERTFDACQGPLGPCDGRQPGPGPANASCRFGHPGGNCGAASFEVLPGETELDFRVLVDRAIVEAFVMRGRAVSTMTFRPLDQGVPDTRVNLVGAATNGASLVVKEANVWSMGCGWEAE